ncbi:hypothetical protein GN244_ATG13545 [Phytophthora infestans]|uniref:Uncharacterized protein n=1 Tax=Phytophthora infestans TaxID=4787 RepID=A0A833SHA2_PHYIN|nr:hypothetical protein GN244_ATG13545 [Phytophthora infestans]
MQTPYLYHVEDEGLFVLSKVMEMTQAEAMPKLRKPHEAIIVPKALVVLSQD